MPVERPRPHQRRARARNPSPICRSAPSSEGELACFPQFLSFGRQMKKATRGPKRPRMASMPCYQCSRRLASQYEILEVVTQTTSAAGPLSSCTRSCTELLCLSVARLVNAKHVTFLTETAPSTSDQFNVTTRQSDLVALI